jgi:hypothetical protein
MFVLYKDIFSNKFDLFWTTKFFLYSTHCDSYYNYTHCGVQPNSKLGGTLYNINVMLCVAILPFCCVLVHIFSKFSLRPLTEPTRQTGRALLQPT